MQLIPKNNSGWITPTSFHVGERGWLNKHTTEDGGPAAAVAAAKKMTTTRHHEAITTILVACAPLVELSSVEKGVVVVFDGACADDHAALARWVHGNPGEPIERIPKPARLREVTLRCSSPVSVPGGYGHIGEIISGVVARETAQVVTLSAALSQKYNKFDLLPHEARIAALAMTAALVLHDKGVSVGDPKELQSRVLYRVMSGGEPVAEKQQPKGPDMVAAMEKFLTELGPRVLYTKSRLTKPVNPYGVTKQVPPAIAIRDEGVIFVAKPYIAEWCKWNGVNRDKLAKWATEKEIMIDAGDSFDFGLPVNAIKTVYAYVTVPLNLVDDGV